MNQDVPEHKRNSLELSIKAKNTKGYRVPNAKDRKAESCNYELMRCSIFPLKQLLILRTRYVASFFFKRVVGKPTEFFFADYEIEAHFFFLLPPDMSRAAPAKTHT